ncbi:MAG: hypothetical protein PVG46_10085, partial [Desulfobacterales bacterium]
QYGAECGFVAKAHPPAHIGICAGGWNAGDGTTSKQDVELFFSRALTNQFNAPGRSIRLQIGKIVFT